MLQVSTRGRPAPRASRSSHSCNARSVYRRVEAMVSGGMGIPAAELRAPSRGPAPVALARQMAMYLAHTALGLGLSGVGRAAGRDRTTVAHACRLLEQRRDEAAIDAMLRRFEDALAPLAALDARARR